MAQKSPTSLATSRNIALRKGTLPAGFGSSEIDPSEQPVVHNDQADQARSVGNTPPPAQPNPFKGAR